MARKPMDVKSMLRERTVVFPHDVNILRQGEIMANLWVDFKRMPTGRVVRRRAWDVEYDARVQEKHVCIATVKSVSDASGHRRRASRRKGLTRAEWLKRAAQGKALLLLRIERQRPELERLLEEVTQGWGYEEAMYCFHSGSDRLAELQPVTRKIVSALKRLAPPRIQRFRRESQPQIFFREFTHIIQEGSRPMPSLTDKVTCCDDLGTAWRAWARSVVEAFLHARFFLEMAVQCGRDARRLRRNLTVGWSALLALYLLGNEW